MVKEYTEEVKQKARRVELVILGAILGAAITLFIRGCSGSEAPATVTIKVPEKKGSFDPVKPVSTPVVQSLNTESDHVLRESKTDVGFNPEYVAKLEAENKELSNIYRMQNDSVKYGLYEKAVQLNTFSQKFEDSLMEIDVEGISRGTVESIGLKYVIKERKTQIPQRQTKFRLLSGVSVSSDVQLQKPLFQANLGFQNKRGNILRFEYDSEKRVSVGYDISIFKIEK